MWRVARFIGCDGPHDEPTEWEWQIVRRDGAVNTMLCDQHFGEWVMTLVAPGGDAPIEYEVVPQDLDDADPAPPAVVDVELPAEEIMIVNPPDSGFAPEAAGWVQGEDGGWRPPTLDDLAKRAEAETAAAEHEDKIARRLAARKSGAATSESVVPWPGEPDA